MKIKHEGNVNLSKIVNEDLVKFITESLEVIEDCKTIIENINEKRSGDIDEFDLLETFDDPTFVNTLSIQHFRNCLLSIHPGINYYMQDIVLLINNVEKNYKKVGDTGVFLSEETENLFINECTEIIGGLCHVLWYEFKIEDFLRDFEIDDKGVSSEIDEIFAEYCDGVGIEPEKVARYVRDLRQDYKFTLRIFDQYPEYQEEFESIMGPYIVGFAEDVLEIDDVLSVIRGDVTPEELCQELEGRGNEIE